MSIICELKGVKKIYRMGDVDVYALRGIALALEKGDFVSIMGTSGSGKSTLLNIIGCLDVPTEGTYLLNTIDISRSSDDELSLLRNRFIGFIFQNFYLLPYATVLENVLLPSVYTRDDTDYRQKAFEILDSVGLRDRARFKPSQLSGGQQQRVAIARALMNDPELILADEPTGQLDSQTAREILDILSDLNKEEITVVLVTHDDKIASYAKRIVKIEDGRIV